MARIVFGAGTSHTPMLLASDETLPRRNRILLTPQAPASAVYPEFAMGVAERRQTV